ncbi:MAG: phosphatase PAP2 family protein [Candidatus Marsarchaeota archaeon]|nr:phosphatase PAP2 family protein [Candidatus Marsarchaeota archaeon]
MSGIITALNTWAFQAVGAISSQPLNSLMAPFAESFFIVLPLVAIWLYYRKDKNVFSFAVAVVGLYIIGDIIKMIVMEPRPCSLPQFSWINQVGCDTTFSFPSNHAMVLTGPLVFLKGYTYLRWLYVIWLVLILFGRVYLGQHYLTDVLAGMLISIFLSYLLYRYRERVNEICMRILSRIPLASRLAARFGI